MTDDITAVLSNHEWDENFDEVDDCICWLKIKIFKKFLSFFFKFEKIYNLLFFIFLWKDIKHFITIDFPCKSIFIFKALQDNPKLIFLKPEWLVECINKQDLIPFRKGFLVKKIK